MGEGETTKPKVEKPKKEHGAPRFHRNNTTKFKAPTPGLEDVVFSTGLAKDVVNFEENKKKLSRYCAFTFKSGGTMVQRAIETMTAPTFNKLAMDEKKWEIE